MIEYITVATDEEYHVAAELFQQYAKDINVDLTFQKFDEELADLRSMYAEPVGGIILCRQDVRYPACIAIRKIDEEICELKRMFVTPGFRQNGIGKGLLANAMELAKRLGYKKIRLDTLDHMHAAIKLYEVNGFKKIQPYYFNPNKTAVFFEKDL